MDIKEFLEDNGCQVEGQIAHAIEEYGIKDNSYDLAYFIMKKLRERNK